MKRVLSVIMLVILLFSLCACQEKQSPIYADDLNDGTYSIEVRSSSSMFRVIACQLTVSDGTMTAAMTLSGTGYEKIFAGTQEEANQAQEHDFSYFTETDDGKYCYEIPVEALNKEISCAAFSIRKQKWYDRSLLFQSDTLPKKALKSSPFPDIIITAAVLLSISIAAMMIIKYKKKRGEPWDFCTSTAEPEKEKPPLPSDSPSVRQAPE